MSSENLNATKSEAAQHRTRPTVLSASSRQAPGPPSVPGLPPQRSGCRTRQVGSAHAGRTFASNRGPNPGLQCRARSARHSEAADTDSNQTADDERVCARSADRTATDGDSAARQACKPRHARSADSSTAQPFLGTKLCRTALCHTAMMCTKSRCSRIHRYLDTGWPVAVHGSHQCDLDFVAV